MNASTSWNAQKGKICNAIARSNGIMKVSTTDKRMNVEALLRTIAQIPEDLQEILSKVRLIPSLVTTLSQMESRIMSTLSDFEALKPLIEQLIAKVQAPSTQLAEVTQQLADTQKQLADALANDKADKDAIDAANAKATELQAAADAKAQEETQLQSEIAQLSQQLQAVVSPAPTTPEVPVATPPDAAPVAPEMPAVEPVPPVQ